MAVLFYKDTATAQGRALGERGLPGAKVQVLEKGRKLVLRFRQTPSSSLGSVIRDAGIDQSHLKYFSYGFRNYENVEYFPTDRIVFELKEGSKLSEVRALASDGVMFESKEYFRYAIAQNQGVDLIDLANRMYESNLVEYAHPDFMVKKRRLGDPLYDEQYYLNSTSGNLGTSDVDIDAPEAWNLTKGSSSVKVAVIDDGVESHEDLKDANGNSRVLTGHTPETGGNGRPVCGRCDVNGDGVAETIGHGMAVSGIIAATHNDTGVRGVAPKVKIVPVNIFTTGDDSPSDVAAGINWAWDEGGADILSNSWGYPPSADFDVIKTAIQDARTQGRSGKGYSRQATSPMAAKSWTRLFRQMSTASWVSEP